MFLLLEINRNFANFLPKSDERVVSLKDHLRGKEVCRKGDI
jgi:hypothetical protein